MEVGRAVDVTPKGLRRSWNTWAGHKGQIDDGVSLLAITGEGGAETCASQRCRDLRAA